MRVRNAEQIGRKVAELRGEMTQEQLARAVGIGRTAITRIESGERALNLAELVAVSAELGVEPNTILYEDGPVFQMRADAQDADLLAEAVAECTEVIRLHRRFRVAAGRS
jgi:transcriptional regulator with XRE-family HTH domain